MGTTDVWLKETGLQVGRLGADRLGATENADTAREATKVDAVVPSQWYSGP
jgi:hypothetical protein